MKQARVHLRVSMKLLKQVRAYADRRQTTVTALVTRFFVELVEEEKEVVEAEQI